MNRGRALVTGATGFIGGRLVEQLILGRGVPVRCLVRDYSRCARIARFPVEMRAGGLTDLAALRDAVAGVDTVYHCAHDYASTATNVAAAEALAEACVAQGVRRLVYVSSMAVYELEGLHDFDESAPRRRAGDAYTAAKLATEDALLAAAQRTGCPVAVLQPTTVYGPWCVAWSLGVARQLRHGKVVLPRDHIGYCNAVYVDDVVDALLLAAERDEAVGQRLLIAGPDAPSWYDFYRAFDRALGTDSVVLMADEDLVAAAGAGAGARVRQLRANPKRLLEVPLVRRAYDRVRTWTGQEVWDRVKGTMPKPLHLPDAGLLALYRSRAIAHTDRARDRLGYRPRYDFADGMHLTTAWLKWANL